MKKASTSLPNVSLEIGWCADAEAAFSVELQWRRRGIGSRMTLATICQARLQGVQRLHLTCCISCRAMLRIAENGAHPRYDEMECFAEVPIAGRDSLEVRKNETLLS